MTIRYVSRDMNWTESMKEQVRAKLVAPLVRGLGSRRFELSVHVDEVRGAPLNDNERPSMEIWAVLQTFDGNTNRILRRRGADFGQVIDEISKNLASQTAKPPRHFLLKLLNPLRHLEKGPPSAEVAI